MRDRINNVFLASLSEKDRTELLELIKKEDNCKNKYKKSEPYEKCKKEINNKLKKNIPLMAKFNKKILKAKTKSIKNKLKKSTQSKMNCSKKCEKKDYEETKYYTNYVKCLKSKCKKESIALKKAFINDFKDTKKAIYKLEKKYKSKSKSIKRNNKKKTKRGTKRGLNKK
jgi:hypothetical protein